MKLVVIVPPVRYNTQDWGVYLGGRLIYTILRDKGYDVDFIDYHLNFKNIENASKELIEKKYDWIGMTAPFALEMASAIELSDTLKKNGYKGHITIGGAAATMKAENVLNYCKSIDSISIGEGSKSIPIFISELINDHSQITTTKGFYFNTKDGIIKNQPDKAIIELDEDPFIEPYRDHHIMNIYTSRGCPHQCSFCSVHEFQKRSNQPLWKAKSPERVVEELEMYNKEYNIKYFIFVDDNFFGSCKKGRERAKSIARLLLEKNLGIHFSIECRVDDVDKRLLNLLKRAGLWHVRLGVESGVQNMLERFNKHVTVKRNIEAMYTLIELGLEINVNYILFDPWTTVEELKENLKFIKETKAYSISQSPLSVYSNHLGIIGGTKVAERLDELDVVDWTFPQVSDYHKKIIRDLGLVIDYKMKEEGMNKFRKVHMDWINKLDEKGSSLMKIYNYKLDELYNDNYDIYTTNIRKWFFNLCELATEIFEFEVENVEYKDEESLLMIINDKLNKYDVNILGSSFEQFIPSSDEIISISAV
ncbi:B12-binding domain-containing radical SAM protein [Wukongibacter sp. M2B1]|uniref:B12-binding domain-containing radical SAM protein n=1 Tax=Wukongibacter sp. M2B1 TaxID=3088895 RepID=UPI003D78B8BA